MDPVMTMTMVVVVVVVVIVRRAGEGRYPGALKRYSHHQYDIGPLHAWQDPPLPALWVRAGTQVPPRGCPLGSSLLMYGGEVVRVVVCGVAGRRRAAEDATVTSRQTARTLYASQTMIRQADAGASRVQHKSHQRPSLERGSEGGHSASQPNYLRPFIGVRGGVTASRGKAERVAAGRTALIPGWCCNRYNPDKNLPLVVQPLFIGQFMTQRHRHYSRICSNSVSCTVPPEGVSGSNSFRSAEKCRHVDPPTAYRPPPSARIRDNADLD
ncbi:hypothetical protein E2C01_030025 [Portunus trituberculatus]|uniref:Secreted protein n=1 Tax=Portunus trituberculatus TaxID=210409 RepID=A0A5B7EQZ2_PORTR|nr:hypothetical protein [Portunus trituberculatus]